jgi:integrase
MPDLPANAKIEALTVGKYNVGDGVFLRVTAAKNKAKAASWIVRYSLNGKQKEMGLGSFADVLRSKARKMGREVKATAAQGIDPKAERKAAQTAQRTFKDAFEDWYEEWHPSLDQKYAKGVYSLIERRILPVLGNMPLTTITTPDVVKAFKRDGFWSETHDSATKTLQSVSLVFSRALALGELKYGNPCADARAGLPTVKVKVKHRKHADYWEVTRIWEWLADPKHDTVATRMHRLLMLTGMRTGEARKLRWDCIKYGPDKRPFLELTEDIAKTEARHVGLSKPAQDLIESMRGFDGHYIFPSPSPTSGTGKKTDGNIASVNILYKHTRLMIAQLQIEPFTPHGWRSTLRGYVKAIAPADLNAAHKVLGHAVGSEVNKVYDRYSDLQTIIEYLDRWADYVQNGDPEQKVVRLVAGIKK